MNQQHGVSRYYKIGEVSRLCDLPSSVLRYWETEFDLLNPQKTPGGQRLYSETDVEVVKLIRQLLYEEEFTVSGARAELKRRLENSSEQQETQVATPEIREILVGIRRELETILSLLQ